MPTRALAPLRVLGNTEAKPVADAPIPDGLGDLLARFYGRGMVGLSDNAPFPSLSWLLPRRRNAPYLLWESSPADSLVTVAFAPDRRIGAFPVADPSVSYRSLMRTQPQVAKLVYIALDGGETNAVIARFIPVGS